MGECHCVEVRPWVVKKSKKAQKRLESLLKQESGKLEMLVPRLCGGSNSLKFQLIYLMLLFSIKTQLAWKETKSSVIFVNIYV